MKLVKLFEMQNILDKHIMNKHPELKGQDNLSWKILALQTELGECANEWRGFKKWSDDQFPRVKVPKHPTMNYEDIEWKNPLLEEFVDCFHFILSIGLELADEWVIDCDYVASSFAIGEWNTATVIEQFQIVYKEIAYFSKWYNTGNYFNLVSSFLGLGEMLGFTWEQIEQAYMTKNHINHQRQEQGY